MEQYIKNSQALEVYNNWDIVSEIYKLVQDNRIYYDNNNTMFADKGGRTHRPVDPIEYSIMLFFQTNKLSYEISLEEFEERFLN